MTMPFAFAHLFCLRVTPHISTIPLTVKSLSFYLILVELGEEIYLHCAEK